MTIYHLFRWGSYLTLCGLVGLGIAMLGLDYRTTMTLKVCASLGMGILFFLIWIKPGEE